MECVGGEGNFKTMDVGGRVLALSSELLALKIELIRTFTREVAIGLRLFVSGKRGCRVENVIAHKAV